MTQNATSTDASAAATASNQSQPTLEHNGHAMTSADSEPEESNPTASTGTTESGEGNINNNGPSPTPSPPLPTSKNPRVWGWPWVVFLAFFYTFILFWMYYAILQRYWIKKNWNDSLPGLDTTWKRKFTMRMHMTMGAISLLLGPMQFVPAFRKQRAIHRWSGRIYCTCAMLSSVFGLWFIWLKQKLVGGYNMTAAFAFAGLSIGVFAFQAWRTARAAKFSSDDDSSNNNAKKALFQFHRNWGIRSYSQILAPALYRYWYIMMELFGLYKTPTPLRNGGYCDEHDQCPDYSRTWDALYCWVYWMSAWLVAEIVIWNLPAYKESRDGDGDGDGNPSLQHEDSSMTEPLLSNDNGNEQTASSNNNTTYGSSESVSGAFETPSIAPNNDEDNDDNNKGGKPVVVNVVGCLLACAGIVITTLTFYTVFTDGDD